MVNGHHYIIIARRNQALLSFLKIRVIINDKEIYSLLNTAPILIPVGNEEVSLVVTDGFHFTRPVKLKYDGPGYFNFEVSCVFDDLHLLAISFWLIILYLLAIITGLLIVKLMSILPVAWFLFFYYFNRDRFLQIKKASAG